MLKPKQLGLHLNDDTIRLPYKAGKISTLEVGVYSYSLPVLTIIVVELIIAVFRRLVVKKTNEWRQMFCFMYNFVVTFLVAAGISLLLTMLIKYTFGRLRPYFLEICQPDILPSAAKPYVDSYTCHGTNERAVSNASLSFLSAHASSSAVGVTYAVLYLQKRAHLRIAPLVRPLIQTTYICSCLYVVFTRFTDFKHHTTDLIGGLFLGCLCALVFNVPIEVVTLFVVLISRMITSWVPDPVFLRYPTDATDGTPTQSDHAVYVHSFLITQPMQESTEV